MHLSLQNSAALAVAFLCARSVASGVKAAPIPIVNLEHVTHSAEMANDLTWAYSATHEKREPDLLKLGSIPKGGENVFSSFLKRKLPALDDGAPEIEGKIDNDDSQNSNKRRSIAVTRLQKKRANAHDNYIARATVKRQGRSRKTLSKNITMAKVKRQEKHKTAVTNYITRVKTKR